MLDEPFTTQESLVNLDHSTECEELSDLSSVPDPEQGLYSSSHFQPVRSATLLRLSTRFSSIFFLQLPFGTIT